MYPLGGRGMIGGVLGVGRKARTYLAKMQGYGFQRILALNESAGTSAADQGTTPYAGTYMGGYTLANKAMPGASMGSAVRLNGSSAYVDIFNGTWASAVSFDAGTYSIWYWTNSLPPLVTYIVNVSQGNKSYILLSEVASSGSGIYRCEIKRNTSNELAASSAISSPTGAWHHYASVWSKAGNYIKVYRDGTEIATAAFGGTGTPTTPTQARLGHYSLFGSYLNGWIGWWGWKNIAASVSEIQDLAVAV